MRNVDFDRHKYAHDVLSITRQKEEKEKKPNTNKMQTKRQ